MSLSAELAAVSTATAAARVTYAETAYTAGLAGPPRTDRERELVGMLLETLRAAGSMLDLLDAITAALQP